MPKCLTEIVILLIRGVGYLPQFCQFEDFQLLVEKYTIKLMFELETAASL